MYTSLVCCICLMAYQPLMWHLMPKFNPDNLYIVI